MNKDLEKACSLIKDNVITGNKWNYYLGTTRVLEIASIVETRDRYIFSFKDPTDDKNAYEDGAVVYKNTNDIEPVNILSLIGDQDFMNGKIINISELELEMV